MAAGPPVPDVEDLCQTQPGPPGFTYDEPTPFQHYTRPSPAEALEVTRLLSAEYGEKKPAAV